MSNIERLKRFLSLFSRSSRVLIIINADPDAIGSAMAVKRLLWRKVHDVVITYFNKITRPDNLEMIDHTDAGLVSLEEINKKDFNCFVVVDSQPDHNDHFKEFELDAIIDHHPLTCDEAEFADIRPEYGACSTMLCEYLKAKKIKPSAKLAAAMVLGIKTDTLNFTRQTSLKDIKAFQYLYRFADKNIVTKVERAVLNQEDLDFLGKAIKGRTILHNRVFFHAGEIDKPDELVMVADFFLTLANINWSIISGVYEKKLIIIIRNDGLRKGAGRAATEAFSDYGSAGGHKTMARAELDIKLVRRELEAVNEKSFAEWVISMIEKNAGKKFK